MFWFATYLILVVALPVLISAVMGYRKLPRGTACPNCAQETLPLLSRTLRVAKRVRPQLALQKRWCPTCSWDGLTRTQEALPVALWQNAMTTRQTRPLRTLKLNGRNWDVMLEYWTEHGRCYGRLLFVAPSGKLWCDPLAAFTGHSEDDVAAQALALSDRLLACRLREVTSG